MEFILILGIQVITIHLVVLNLKQPQISLMVLFLLANLQLNKLISLLNFVKE